MRSLLELCLVLLIILSFLLIVMVVHSKTPRDWASVEELEEFLAGDDTDSHVYLRAGPDGVVRFNNQCEDRAIRLMDNAAGVGKRLSFVPLHPAEYEKWYGDLLEPGHYHAVCGAIVGGNSFYYIEPGDDRVWLAQHFD